MSTNKQIQAVCLGCFCKKSLCCLYNNCFAMLSKSWIEAVKWAQICNILFPTKFHLCLDSSLQLWLFWFLLPLSNNCWQRFHEAGNGDAQTINQSIEWLPHTHLIVQSSPSIRAWRLGWTTFTKWQVWGA